MQRVATSRICLKCPEMERCPRVLFYPDLPEIGVGQACCLQEVEPAHSQKVLWLSDSDGPGHAI